MFEPVELQNGGRYIAELIKLADANTNKGLDLKSSNDVIVNAIIASELPDYLPGSEALELKMAFLAALYMHASQNFAFHVYQIVQTLNPVIKSEEQR